MSRGEWSEADRRQFEKMQEIMVAVIDASIASEADRAVIVAAVVTITVEACLRVQSVEATRRLFTEQIDMISAMIEQEQGVTAN